MSHTLDDKDVGTLLAPVNMGSFALSPNQSSRETFSGIPTIDKSKMWDFSLTEDKDKKRILSFRLDNGVVNFRLEHPEKPGTPIRAKRLPDTQAGDFGVGGSSSKGRAQIHRASPSNIFGTFQTGRTNTTFEISKASDNEEDWNVVPRKNPTHDINTFVQSILDKNEKVAIDPSMLTANILPNVQNQLGLEGEKLRQNQEKYGPGSEAGSSFEEQHPQLVSALNAAAGTTVKAVHAPARAAHYLLGHPQQVLYPLSGTTESGSALPSMGIAGGIGVGVMGVRNLIQRLFGVQHASLGQDLLVGGAAGAGISGLYHALGSTDGLNESDKSIYENGWAPGVAPRVPSFYDKPTVLDKINAMPTPKIAKENHEVTCSSCHKKFDYNSEPEKSMGSVECPGCAARLDQEGKTARSETLNQLLEAKGHSDKKNYGMKNDILRRVLAAKPEEFHVDSHLNKGIVGLTHDKTHFKIHAPKKYVPSEVLFRKEADIAIKDSRKGLLHKNLGVPEGERISDEQLEKAKATASPEERRRIVFAQNARKWNHKKAAGVLGDLVKAPVTSLTDTAKLLNANWQNSVNQFNPANNIPNKSLIDQTRRIVKQPQGASIKPNTPIPAFPTPKEASLFSSGNQEVDLIALQGILGADPSITPGDRNVLLDQARTAMQHSGGQPISLNKVEGWGLGMLSGYVMSKLMGFGSPGTLASMAIGGALGGMGPKEGPTWNSGGYYVY